MTDQFVPPPYAPQPNELPSDAPAYTEPESLRQRRVAMLLMAPHDRYVLSIGSLPDHSCMIDSETSALDVLASIGWRIVAPWEWVSGFLMADIEPAYLAAEAREDLGEPGVEDLPDPSRYVADAAGYVGAYDDDEPISEDERLLSAEVRQAVHEVVLRVGEEGVIDLGDFTQYADDVIEEDDPADVSRLTQSLTDAEPIFASSPNDPVNLLILANERELERRYNEQHPDDELDDADDQAERRLDDAVHQDELEREHAEQHDE